MGAAGQKAPKTPIAVALATAIAVALATLALTGCTLAPTRSAKDYANAVALNDPDGSLTTIVGPATAIVTMTSTVKFPEGDSASGVRSVLMYDRPSGQGGFCLFQIGHTSRFASSVVKEDVVQQPCDGKRWARFRIAGTDLGFVAHLMHTNYKGTPVILLEIGEHRAPESIRIFY
jgi:hypothetical protein